MTHTEILNLSTWTESPFQTVPSVSLSLPLFTSLWNRNGDQRTWKKRNDVESDDVSILRLVQNTLNVKINLTSKFMSVE